MSGVDWETWLVEDAGHAVVVKKSQIGLDELTPAERLTYCLWVADYGMRNAGDLQTAADLYAPFHVEGAQIASQLSLSTTSALFGSSAADFQRDYFNKFDDICTEIAGALGSSSQPAT